MKNSIAFLLAGFLFVVSLSIGIDAQGAPPTMIRGGVLNGKAVSLPKPLYPEEAKIAGVGGLVRVQVMIDEGGNVASAAAEKPIAKQDDTATPTPEEANRARLHEMLERSAEDAARQARFTQTLLSGVPVKVSGVIVYNFTPAASSDEPRTINGGVLNGKAVSLPKPVYPPAARAVNASGAVSVQVAIDENGSVISAVAVSGHPLLRAAAEDAAREAKFSPTFLNGSPVKITGVVTYVFQLPKKTPPASGSMPQR
jgi:TonB family protein